MNSDLYTKSVEELIIAGLICLSPIGMRTETDAFGQPHEVVVKDGQWWKACRWPNFHISGEGATPREAIIDLYKKL
jgi:hypothetical protein